MLDLGSILTRERRPKLRIASSNDAPTVKERSIPTAELVECNCPEPCERDHETD